MLPLTKKSRHVVYLDHAATTAVDSRVQKAMKPFWTDIFANPSSLYSQAKKAAESIVNARTKIATILGCQPSEIIFTAGGSESINLAIFGAAREYSLRTGTTGHLITSAIEHHSVLHSYAGLEQEGWKTSYIPVDEQGFLKIDRLKKLIRPDTILVSIMYANNEIGTIEPIAEIGKWLKALNIKRATQGFPRILFHTDACQAAGALELQVDKLHVDLMTVNGSKIYGPKQTGFLFVRKGISLRPLIYGGGQEKNLRSGTENVPGIIGLAEALQLAQKDRLKENKRLIQLCDYFISQLSKKLPDSVLNGPAIDSNTALELQRLPNNINISFPGIEAEALLLYLDSYNIAVSTGSACATSSPNPSHVLIAIGLANRYVQGSIRLTLGRQIKKKQLDYVLQILPAIVRELERTVH